MNTVVKFILVDDDPISTTICGLVIKKTLGDTDIKIFNHPEKGLAYLKYEYINNISPAVMLLDINMPTLTGFEFLEQFHLFDNEIKQNIYIWMLSSSVNQKDKDKASANKYVKGFILKPLSRDIITSIASGAFTVEEP